MARRKSHDITGSTIILGGTGTISVFHELGMDRVQSSRVCKRSTEIVAEQRAKIGQITDLHRELMYLERVALQPDKYPEVKDRPARRISGITMYRWLGKRLQIGTKDVEAYLQQIEVITSQNARAYAW